MALATENGGGFDANFVGQGEVSDFECPVCLHVTRDPNLTSCCGQHFCATCIGRIITDGMPCPLCKETRFTVLLDKKQKRKVFELNVKCSECSRGCSWTGPLGDLDTHVSNDCEFVDVGCPNECGEELQRRLLEEHLAESCIKRSLVCPYCGIEDTYLLIYFEHTPTCPKCPVSCPNKCTQDMFERATLEEHTEQVCPLQQVDCEYQSFGCTTPILRKDMAKHMEENIQRHMLLMTKELKSTKQTIATLTEKVTFLEKSTLAVPLTFYVRKFSQLKNSVSRIAGQYTLLTHPNGYRLRLGCFATNGALKFLLKKLGTDYDDYLRWPLRCTVVLTVFNQANDQVHMRRSSTVCVEDKVCLITNITYAKLERAVSNDRLLFKVDIVDVNN